VSSTSLTASIGHRNPIAAARAFREAVLRRVRQIRLGVRLHHLLFLAFTLTAAVPIAALAFWEESVAFQHELASVRERHLLVARNLSAALSRYVEDVKGAFSLAFEITFPKKTPLFSFQISITPTSPIEFAETPSIPFAQKEVFSLSSPKSFSLLEEERDLPA